MSSYLIAGAAVADSARAGIVIRYLRDVDRATDTESPQVGLPRLVTIEVTPEEVGPNGVRLDASSRAKLAAAGLGPDEVERQLHGMKRGDKKLLADVVYGADSGVPRREIDEQLRWFGIAPTEDEEERIARGETVTFLLDA
jgi:hypothetical protein